MKRLLRACVISAIVASPLLAVGCAEDNEKTANIKGQAPPGGGPKTQAELSPQAKGSGQGLKSQGYPGAKQ